jgi:hypothetical protein
MRVLDFPLALGLAAFLCAGFCSDVAICATAATSPTTTTVDAASAVALKQLEEKYFEHSFGNDDDLQTRVERLEKQIYGDPLTGSLADRIKRMAATLPPPPEADPSEMQNAKNPLADQQAVSNNNRTPAVESEGDDGSDAQNPSEPRETYPRVTSLESLILGQTYPTQSLALRLGRMETKAFGGASDTADLSQRTDALEQYADRTLHKKPLGLEQNRDRNSDSARESGSPTRSSGQSAMPKQLMALAGSSLLAVASSALGVPAFVPALAGAGMRAPSNNSGSQQQANDQQGDAPPEDPAIFAAEPPPASARLQTKVGWCEVQLFGRTFSYMHLKERLRQLSRELNVAVDQSDLELMDDAGSFIKAVQQRKRTAQQ